MAEKINAINIDGVEYPIDNAITPQMKQALWNLLDKCKFEDVLNGEKEAFMEAWGINVEETTE